MDSTEIVLSEDTFIAKAKPNARTNVKFQDSNLPAPLLRAMDELGFEFYAPIQAQSVKITLQGHDIAGKAQTGTGTTAAFLPTIINDRYDGPINEDRYVGEP